MTSSSSSQDSGSSKVIELTSGQKALWTAYQLDHHKYLYNSNFIWRVRFDLNIDAFERALKTIQQRHDMWRTTFELRKGVPVQVIHESFDLPLSVIDATDWSEKQVDEAVRHEVYNSFDLEREVSLQWKLLQRGDEADILCLRVQHAACDGFSIFITIKELIAYYTAYCAGNDVELPEVQGNMQDYADWINKQCAGKKGQRMLKFWLKELEGELPILNLPLDRPHSPEPTFHSAHLKAELPQEKITALKALGQANDINFFTIFLGLFQTLLHRYSGQTEILTGTPTAVRPLKFQNLYGYCVNPIVFRTQIQEKSTFMDLMKGISGKFFNLLKNQNLPFPDIAAHLSQERDPNRAAIFQNMYIYEAPNSLIVDGEPIVTLTEDGKEIWNLGEYPLERIDIPYQIDNFDIRLRVIEIGERIQFNIEYLPDLFEKDTIKRIKNSFLVLIDTFLANPNSEIGLSNILGEADQELILNDWNETDTDLNEGAFAPDLISQNAADHPEKSALWFGDQHFTYADIEAKANQIAHLLKAAGVGPDVLVGIGMRRSPEMILAVLAVHKAGGAYVPLDPNYPPERIEYILEEAQAPIVLTQSDLKETYAKDDTKLIFLDDATSYTDQPTSAPEHRLTPDLLSHVIYTSGSTGKPKGVAIPHRAVCALIDWVKGLYSQAELSGVLASTSLNFDLSVYEIVCTLSLSGTIILVENALYLPTDANKDKVHLLNTVPSAIKELLRQKTIPESVLTVNLAGEPLKETVVQALYKLSHIDKVYNLYGPSEDTTYSTWALMERDDDYTVMIGYPLTNTQAYILDPNLQPVPIGVPGELYLSGKGLARGYLNRPDLTKERFVPNPFSKDAGSRMYRTGDLVRWWSNGQMECLGRIDHQVKIRGFRIELGEIEAVLNRNEAIRESVVVAREMNEEKVLVGYVTLHEGEPKNEQDLRNDVGEHLPEYMVPAFMVILDEMPLNPNGKIDRKKLPEPKLDIVEDTTTVDEAPPMTSVLENTIADTLKAILSLSTISPTKKFFEIGLNSITAVSFRLQLEKELGRKIPTTAIFQNPTVKALALFLDPSIAQKSLDTRSSAIEKDDIAIVGFAGRFPQSESAEAFWDNIEKGVECITRFSHEELLEQGHDPEMLDDPNYVRAGGYLKDSELFDAEFFGVNPREAEVTDPQHRLFLENAWQSFEHAGYNPETVDGRVGVFAGTSMNTYFTNNLATNKSLLDLIGFYGIMIGNEKDFLATRVAFKLNLKGPAVLVQTACSTSLVAIHLACKNLLEGECDMALAGGVCAQVPQKYGYMYTEGGTLSPDGHVRPFDKDAAGMLGGNGVGTVLLKRLKDAERDGDHIHAVIKGTAINNDGSDKIGFTAPSVDGQATVIADAMQMGNVKPESVTYIETHGTGTNLGDPIEISGLTRAYNQLGKPKPQQVALGSVKANIGHLDTAAGVAGVIKTTMALKHRKLPPLINFNEANPEIDFASTPFYVNTQLRDWVLPEGVYKRRAGISSFGMGGTNAHAVLEEYELPKTDAAKGYQLLPYSGRSNEALDALEDQFAAFLSQNPDASLADIAFTLQLGRKPLSQRSFVIAEHHTEAVEKFSARPRNDKIEALAERPVIFMFSGQGSQYIDMSLDLYREEPEFKKHVDQCCELLYKHTNLDLRDLLFPSLERSEPLNDDERADLSKRINQTSMAQPALFVIEYATAKFLMDLDIKPSSMIGHSIGEYAAACLAGVFDLETALELVAARGQLMQAQAPGGMLAIPRPEEEVRTWLNENVDMATINAHNRCVVAGPYEHIDALFDKLKEEGIPASKLHTSHAFHSSMMESMLEPFKAKMRKMTFRTPSVPFVSNLTGEWITPDQATNPDYWANHLRNAVRFYDGIRLLSDTENAAFIEVGPGRTLMTFAKTQLSAEKNQFVLTTIRHPKGKDNDQRFFLNSLGQLWQAGLEIDWKTYHKTSKRLRLPLPTYPFQRKRYWIEPKKAEPISTPSEASAPMQHKPVVVAPAARESKPLTKVQQLDNWFYLPLWRQSPPKPIGSQLKPQQWLLFMDAQGVSEQLAQKLEQQGHQVVCVKAGEWFSKRTSNQFTIDPASKEDYQRLFRELAEDQRLPHQIVHAFSIFDFSNFSHPMTFAERCQDLGFNSIVSTVQAYEEYSSNEFLHINVLSNNMQEVNEGDLHYPEKATLLGACKVIPREYPHINCRSVDLDLPNNRESKRLLIRQLIGELLSPNADTIVAYRGRRRWLQTFEPVELPRTRQDSVTFRNKGTYLIVGGLGQIGMATAEYLSQNYQAKLILTRKTSFPDQADWERYVTNHDPSDPTCALITALRQLEQNGSQLLVKNADVSDLDEMQSVVETAMRKFGRIDGVIHAADLPFGGLVKDLTREKSLSLLSTKVQGSLVLDHIFKPKEVDFIALFSSTSGILGNMGHAVYCGASCFLDAFAHKRNSGTAFTTLTINWDYWAPSDNPAFKEENASLPDFTRILDRMITKEEGMDCLERIMASKQFTQTIVSQFDLIEEISQIRAYEIEHIQDSLIPVIAPTEPKTRPLNEDSLYHATKPAADTSPKAMPEPPKPAVEEPKVPEAPPTQRGPQLEDTIAKIRDLWQESIGVNKVDLNDDFNDLGGDSLMATMIASRLRKIFKLRVPPSLFNEKPTLKEMAEHIHGQIAAGSAPAAASPEQTKSTSSPKPVALEEPFKTLVICLGLKPEQITKDPSELKLSAFNLLDKNTAAQALSKQYDVVLSASDLDGTATLAKLHEQIETLKFMTSPEPADDEEEFEI